MFDWFWEFLYKISRALFQVLDAMLYSAKKLCGIDDVFIDGEATDFLSYLIRSSRIQYAFSIAAIVASTLCVFFAILEILRTIVKEKNESPARIAIKAGKNIFVFLFVPMLMYVTMGLLNAVGQVMYNATMGSDVSSLGGYLFTAFAESGNAWKGSYTEDFITSVEGKLIANYSSMSDVKRYIDISDFNFIMSWLTSIILMFPIGTMLLMFVDRAISIAILYIAAPFSISASIVDDGARFKLWRDQVLVKFITGYGAIISLNIYAVCMNLVMNRSLVFFPDTATPFLPFFSNNFLNLLVKLVFLIGGAFSMQKIMALIGNLVSQGAGSNELRDTAIGSAGMGRLLGKAGGMAFKAAKGVAGKALGTIGKATGLSDMASRVKEATSAGISNLGRSASNKMLGLTKGGRALKQYTDKMRDNNQPINKATLTDILNNTQKKGGGGGDDKPNKNTTKQESKGQSTLANSINNSNPSNSQSKTDNKSGSGSGNMAKQK